jgi:hypothetical protein
MNEPCSRRLPAGQPVKQGEKVCLAVPPGDAGGGVNGTPHDLEPRRRWSLLVLGNLPKKEHPIRLETATTST